MSIPHLFRKPSPGGVAEPGPADGRRSPEVAARPLAPGVPAPNVGETRQETTRSKLAEGARGIKLAIRAESGFFAHAYRGLLIAISAAILGVSPTGWCFLIVSAALVLVAEAFRCAVHAALDAIGEPGDPKFRNVREIATGGLLFASITSACLTLMVLSSKLGDVLGW